MTFKSEKAKIFYDYLLNLNQDEIFTIASVVNHTSWSAERIFVIETWFTLANVCKERALA